MTNKDEYVQLLSRHQGQIFRLIYFLVPHFDDAQDLFQQTSITMWEHFGEFRQGSDFVAWAATIARNKALNYFSSRARSKYVFSQQLLSELATPNDGSDEYQIARLESLHQCRSKLDENDRQLLKLCYEENSSIRDVAKGKGCTPNSLYCKLNRIRRNLMDCIQLTLAKEGRL